MSACTVGIFGVPSNTALRESVFGYITVLPGAFSAYRYIALQNDVTGEGPLQKYFLGEKMVAHHTFET